MTNSPILMWFRRDLRLGDHAALTAACATGRPVIPVFIHDEEVARLGAAPKLRMGLAIDHFANALKGQGSHLVLRKGAALDVLRDLVAQTGAGAVYWSRLYDPASKARDTDVKAALKADGIDAQSFAGNLLFSRSAIYSPKACCKSLCKLAYLLTKRGVNLSKRPSMS